MPDLKPHLHALDDRRSEFLAALESITPTDLARSPGVEQWSPLQIGEHLLKTEAGLARVMGRQLDKGDDRRDVGTPSERSVEGLIRALRTPAKFKVPDGAAVVLPSDDAPPLAALREQWLQVGERWHAHAERHPDALADTGIVHHAVAGALTFEQTLRFLEAHVEHHLHQLGRTVRAFAA